MSISSSRSYKLPLVAVSCGRLTLHSHSVPSARQVCLGGQCGGWGAKRHKFSTSGIVLTEEQMLKTIIYNEIN